jgi:hypothetical protein
LAEKTANIDLGALLAKIDEAEDIYPFLDITMYIRAVISEIGDRQGKTKS